MKKYEMYDLYGYIDQMKRNISFYDKIWFKKKAHFAGHMPEENNKGSKEDETSKRKLSLYDNFNYYYHRKRSCH